MYGYSLGGIAATGTADRVIDDNIDINLLITVDAALGPLSGHLQVPSNVKVNVNYFQTHRSAIFSRGSLSQPKPGNRRTKFEPHDWTNKTSGKGGNAHNSIDEDTLERVINRIKISLY